MTLSAISNESEVQFLNAMKDGVVEGTAHLQAVWLRSNNLIVAPVTSACHFNAEQAENLARAFESARLSEIYAVATEPLEHFPRCFLVETTARGLLEFSWECSHFNFVLLPGEITRTRVVKPPLRI
ncbi:MAG TPA: hypothetical protein VFB15_13460 [Candidatus Binataceae bacterium]|nr:hypothetical protein [Candidatus Binataceae bacterium]